MFYHSTFCGTIQELESRANMRVNRQPWLQLGIILHSPKRFLSSRFPLSICCRDFVLFAPPFYALRRTQKIGENIRKNDRFYGVVRHFPDVTHDIGLADLAALCKPPTTSKIGTVCITFSDDAYICTGRRHCKMQCYMVENGQAIAVFNFIHQWCMELG